MGKARQEILGKTFDRLGFGLYILVALAILGVINWFVERHNHQLDLTPSGRYSSRSKPKGFSIISIRM